MTDSSELVHTDDNLVIELPLHEALPPRVDIRTHADVLLLLPQASSDRSAVESRMVVRLNEALDASQEMILVVEPSGLVLFANITARRLLGLHDAHPVIAAIQSLLGGPERSTVWSTLKDSDQWSGGLALTGADGSPMHTDVTLFADRTNAGDIRSFSIVSHRTRSPETPLHAQEPQTTHDGLTGLSNRQHLLTELNTILPELAAGGRAGALLVVDIDEFRTVTNSLGHQAGDRVLVAFAYRLLRSFEPGTILARVGGDEFAIFCPGQDDAEALAQVMVAATAAPFFINGSEVHLSVVTGIAISSPDNPAPDGEALLREADAASYRAKERGRGSFEVFEQQLHTDAVDRLGVVEGLRKALRNNELRVLYQPKISLATGRIVGAEALMRWQTPTGELRGPAEFMDVAEDTGLIIPMGRWILQQVCGSAVELQRVNPIGDFELSINLSVRQLADAAFASHVEAALANSGIDPRLIELEITESALMDDVGASAELLTRLKALGTRIAVDDFGTGYSSLQYLQRLPVDVLKVDQTFVAGIEQNEGDRAIVTAVIHLAKALRLTSVAEGVETAGQLACLRDLGCDQAQGYHFAAPVTVEALAELVATEPRW
ncbi:MAG: putative bifunctional diguanylate cyclase/phosphodiesterase [Acidimicrobiales bacterium]